MRSKKEQKKILITRIFCAFLAFMMVVGVIYSAVVYL